MNRRFAVLAMAAACTTGAIAGDIDLYPEGAEIPRNLTPEEQEIVKVSPLAALRGSTPPPSGPIVCPPEYAPMDGILIAWEGSASWLTILRTMAVQITTLGDADLYVVVDTASEQTSANSSLSAAGANMSRVHFVVRTTDTIWIRDYGPRYIYEGGVRAIIDHTYNRPRPNDDILPGHFASIKGHPMYEIPLVHGGGNYHLCNMASRTSRLINNENPGLTEQQIHDYWLAYQNLDTNFYTPFPTSVDLTQHIDMWMQVIADDAVVISDWPFNSGSTQDVICDQTAAAMATEGYAVHRVPARSVGGTHYTYTNVVMCNDLVLLPFYANASVSQHNAEALATWQAALPGHTIVQVACDSIVTAAGVMHCIVMHVPASLGGENPVAYLKNLNGGEEFEPDDMVEIRWITDDDEDVVNVDLLLSTDGGANFPTVIAGATPDDGSFMWTVPDVNTSNAMIRVVARDGDSNTGFDDSDAPFAIAGSCPADLDGDGSVGSSDLAALLGAWGAPGGPADITGDGGVGAADLAAMLGAWGPCP